MAINKTIFILAFLTISLRAYGQGGQIMEYLDPNFQNSTLLYAKRPLTDTPYLILEFSPGEVVMNDGKVVKNVELLLDIEKQQALIKTGDDMGIVNNKYVQSLKLTMPGKAEPTLFIARSQNGAIAYFEVLYDGNIKVLKRSDKKKRSVDQVTSTGYNSDGPKPSRFMKSESFYLLMADQLTPVKLSKKSILAALKEANYETCAKSLDLKLNSVSDLIILLNDCK
jgi:hypothetical protein